MANIANLFDRIGNPWIKWPLVMAFGIVLILASLVVAQAATGVLHWVSCLGKETLFCGRVSLLNQLPATL